MCCINYCTNYAITWERLESEAQWSDVIQNMNELDIAPTWSRRNSLTIPAVDHDYVLVCLHDLAVSVRTDLGMYFMIMQ